MTATSTVSAVGSSTSRRCGRVGYLVLFALAWFQVAFASHQFEHVTGDRFDVCTVCKHMERQAAAAPEPAQIAFAAPSPIPLAGPINPVSAKVVRNYESRAPPSA